MRSTIRSIAYVALLSTAVLAAGCDTSEARPSAGVLPAAGAERQKASKEAKEAVQATKEYASALRAEFVKDMQKQLAAINRELQQLSAKVESSNNAAKADAKARLQALRDKAARLDGELEKARNADEAAWGRMKASVERSHEDLKESVAQARGWLAEKIAP